MEDMGESKISQAFNQTQQGSSGKPSLISKIIDQQKNATDHLASTLLQFSLFYRISKGKVAPLSPFSL